MKGSVRRAFEAKPSRKSSVNLGGTDPFESLKHVRQILGRDHVHIGYFRSPAINYLCRGLAWSQSPGCVKNLRHFQLRNAHILDCRERVYLPFTKHRFSHARAQFPDNRDPNRNRTRKGSR